MSFGRQHEIHKRRLGRNIGLGLVLAGLVAVVFGMTVAKVSRGDFALAGGGQTSGQATGQAAAQTTAQTGQ